MVYLKESCLPSKEMVDFFEERTCNHIQRVVNNSYILSKRLSPEIGNELNKVVAEHDRSKYSHIEFLPYVWLTWIKKPGNESLDYDKNFIDSIIEKAWDHHKLFNKHHPEFFVINYGDVNFIDEVSLAEMVADWHSMSQELGGSTFNWFENSILKKFNFSEKNCIKILNLIGMLENK